MKNKKLYYVGYYKKTSNKSDNFNALPPSKWPDSWKQIYFKGYPRFEKMQLDRAIWEKNNTTLTEAIFTRRSSRKSSGKRLLTKDDVSFLLMGAAITSVGKGNISYDTRRAQPSAGSRYPLEVYAFILQPKDLKSGIYHYHVRTHSLEYLWEMNPKALKSLTMQQTFPTKAKAFFLITAIMNRGVEKYRDKAYRFALIEAGHLAQNVLLLATALGFNSCPVGDLFEKGFVKLLELNAEEELILYSFCIL